MADIKKIAKDLVNLSVKDVSELANILKDEYGIEPAAAATVVAGGAAAERPIISAFFFLFVFFFADRHRERTYYQAHWHELWCECTWPG